MSYYKISDEIKGKDDPILNLIHEEALKDEFEWDTQKEGALKTVTYNEIFKNGERVDYNDGISIVYVNPKDIQSDTSEIFFYTNLIVLKQV